MFSSWWRRCRVVIWQSWRHPWPCGAYPTKQILPTKVTEISASADDRKIYWPMAWSEPAKSRIEISDADAGKISQWHFKVRQTDPETHLMFKMLDLSFTVAMRQCHRACAGKKKLYKCNKQQTSCSANTSSSSTKTTNQVWRCLTFWRNWHSYRSNRCSAAAPVPADWANLLPGCQRMHQFSEGAINPRCRAHGLPEIELSWKAWEIVFVNLEDSMA